MSEIKWIKILTGIFDDEKIKLIDSMPDRDSVFTIWIKLLTLAGKINDNGCIYVNEDFPYTDEMLSTIFNRPLNTIRMALDIFRKFKMIEILKNGKIYICNWEKHQNIDGMDKIRQQNKLRQEKYRNRLIESNVISRDSNAIDKNRIDKNRLEENNISIDDIDNIYKEYPSRCIVNNRSLSKSNKDKEKIKKMLKDKTKDEMITHIKKYVRECARSKTFMMNFSTFLNQWPEVPDAPLNEYDRAEMENEAYLRKVRGGE